MIINKFSNQPTKQFTILSDTHFPIANENDSWIFSYHLSG